MADVNATVVSFDGTDLSTISGLRILATTAYQPAKRKLATSDIARTNRSTIDSAFYNKRTVSIGIGINRATRDLVEQSLDSLYTILQGREKILQVKQSGGNRQYTATYSDTVFKVEGGAYIEAALVFETSDHFGYDANPTLLLQVSGYTSGQRTDALTVGGSAPWQQPIITLTLTSLTGSSTRSVIIGNGATGQAVTISRTWASGDVIQISAPDGTVKVNGIAVAWSGAIPEFAPSTGYLTYSDTFTARTFSNNVIYYKRYV